jgi:hypothetical protein
VPATSAGLPRLLLFAAAINSTNEANTEGGTTPLSSLYYLDVYGFIENAHLSCHISLDLYHKTFYSCNEFLTVISYSVCHCQSFPPKSNISGAYLSGASLGNFTLKKDL